MQASASSTARQLAQSTMDTRMNFKSGADVVSVGSLRMQNAVPPQERIQVTAEVVNNASVIIGDPDACDTGLFRKGYQIDAELYVDGEFLDSITACIPGTNGSKEFTFEFIAPKQEGDYDVTVKAVGASSGHVGDTLTETLTVDSEAPGGSTPGEDDDGSGAYLPCFMDPNRACSTGETIAFAGMGGSLALLLLLALVGP